MKLNQAFIGSAIMGILIIVVLFNIYAAIVPEAQTAGTDLTDAGICVDVGCFWNETHGALFTGNTSCQVSSELKNETCSSDYTIPLGNLFNSSGIVFLVIMVALLIIVLRGYLKKGGK